MGFGTRSIFGISQHISHLFCFLVLMCTIGKETGHSFKYNRSKLSSSTLKKPVLSYSAAHTSSLINSTGTSISSQLDNKNITRNQNNNNTSNTEEIHSFVTPWRQNYSVQTTYKTTCLTPLNTILPIEPVDLHTTTQFPPDGKEYLCFQIKKLLSCFPVCKIMDTE